jgi:hypothetical protein
MSIIHRVDHALRRVITTASGPVTLPEMREHLADLRSEAALGYDELIDARTASAVLVAEDVHRLVEVLEEMADQEILGLTAIVVSDDVSYGMTRMLDTLAQEYCVVRPFRDMAEAVGWLDHPGHDPRQPSLQPHRAGREVPGVRP